MEPTKTTTANFIDNLKNLFENVDYKIGRKAEVNISTGEYTQYLEKDRIQNLITECNENNCDFYIYSKKFTKKLFIRIIKNDSGDVME